MFILISWNLCFLPFQNLTALARIFPSAAWLKQVSCHPHSRKLNSTVSSLGPPDGNTVHEPLAVRNPKIIIIKQETPTSSWYLTNGVVSYHSSLTAATKGKGYSLRIVPKYSSSLLCLGSFLSGRENRSDPLNGEERQGLKSTESALRNYIIQRDVCYWKTKGDLASSILSMCEHRTSFLHAHCPFQLVNKAYKVFGLHPHPQR